MSEEEKLELREKIKAHAKEHYNDGGWDVIVECWEDAELDELIEEHQADSMSFVKTLVSVWKERQENARICGEW
jgi:hypothetical protein